MRADHGHSHDSGQPAFGEPRIGASLAAACDAARFGTKP
jgi:hypothetical protein